VRRTLIAFVASLSGLPVSARPAAGAWPGRYGPFYRTGSTQDDDTIRKQKASQEVWGKANRGSFHPSVDAYRGNLPANRHGIEFYTDVEPTPGSPPGKARWLGPRRGVRIEGDWAKIAVNITVWRFNP
jgi:hypothetical protein